MANENPFALGFIETQGFTAVFEAIDTACKAANVEVVGKEKLGGGYVTVVVKGDLAAVTAAIEAGKAEGRRPGQADRRPRDVRVPARLSSACCRNRCH